VEGGRAAGSDAAQPVNATAAALLGLLRGGPLSGYALYRLAADRLGDFWTVTRSQVYRELAAMASRGLVTVDAAGPRDRRDHRLTDDGRAAFRAWLHDEPGPDVVRIPLLLRLAFADELAPDRLAEVAAAQRATHAQRLAHYREVEATALAAGAGDRDLVTLRFGLRYEEAVLRWFDDELGDGGGGRA
jgi:DNA-binding PadR family transcriptional regulator